MLNLRSLQSYNIYTQFNRRDNSLEEAQYLITAVYKLVVLGAVLHSLTVSRLLSLKLLRPLSFDT